MLPYHGTLVSAARNHFTLQSRPDGLNQPLALHDSYHCQQHSTVAFHLLPLLAAMYIANLNAASPHIAHLDLILFHLPTLCQQSAVSFDTASRPKALYAP